eukprot:SM000168S02607  [mRNA]  locus=s168:99255:100514:- [translate_table: standard]
MTGPGGAAANAASHADDTQGKSKGLKGGGLLPLYSRLASPRSHTPWWQWSRWRPRPRGAPSPGLSGGSGLRRTKSGGAAAAVSRASVVAVVVGYGLSSSTLAIVNKYAVTVFPYPGALTALQYAASTATVAGLGAAGTLQHDRLLAGTLARFFPAALVFYLAILTNTQLLLHANVETFIVFRSSTPLLVALADSLFMGRPWPSGRTFASLFVILGGALGYVLSDSQFSVTAYSWAVAYLATITLEMVYIKHIVSSIGLSTWGLVLYNNLVSLALSPLFLLGTGELRQLAEEAGGGSGWWPPAAGTAAPVAASCALGLAISFFGFAARRAVSATTFTVVGVTNKLLTIAINVAMWDKHASPSGIAALLVCIFGGVLYQQATSRSGRGAQPLARKAKATDAATADDASLFPARPAAAVAAP